MRLHELLTWRPSGKDGDAPVATWTGVRDLVQAVESLGFGAKPAAAGGRAADPEAIAKASAGETARWRGRLQRAVALTLPALAIHWLCMLNESVMHTMDRLVTDPVFPNSRSPFVLLYCSPPFLSTHPPVVPFPLPSCSTIGHSILTERGMLFRPLACHGQLTWKEGLLLVLITPLQFGVGFHFYRSAFLGALHGNYGMDVLVVTGTTAAYGCVFLPLFRARPLIVLSWLSFPAFVSIHWWPAWRSRGWFWTTN